MDVLSRGRWRSRRGGAALLLVLPVAACLLLPGTRTTPSRFSHAVHVGGEGLDCTFCHNRADIGRDAGMPGPALCRPCHDKRDPGVPPEQRIDDLFGPDHRYAAVTGVASVPADVRFAHGPHAAAGVACADCHGDIARSDGIPPPLVAKDDCMGCHAARGKSNDCGICHQEMSADWIPSTHGADWHAVHGQVVRSRDDRSVHRCSLCHDAEASCSTCHRESPPDDHTEHFRLRGHALATSIDRNRCATCHRRDFCQSCHETVSPLNHVAGFGGMQARHCTSCHFPLRDNGCATCHRDLSGHAMAAPLPADHSPAMDCRQCHGLFAPLPHPDGGHNCTTCHR